MTTYAIGDVQGCYSQLRQLLDNIKFDPATDTLWFVGDLVNRGPDSLLTLRFVKSLGKSAISVLGNHDIHLLAVYYGLRPRAKDPTLHQVLDAIDIEELIAWLQQLPLMHTADGFTMVHAGIHPRWSLETATDLARELESGISAISVQSDLQALYGKSSGNWDDNRNPDDRLRFALNCFTRIRYCDEQSAPDFTCSEPPGNQPANLIPWYDVPDRLMAEQPVIFGHWASLGLHKAHPVYALDSGCVWGNALTAMRLDNLQTFSVSCKA